MKSGKLVLGFPKDAPKMAYMAYKAKKFGVPIVHTTSELCYAINSYFA